MTSAKSWEYLRCHEVAFLADGKPVKVGSSKHEGQVQRGYVIEIVVLDVPAESLDALATATTIEMRVCNTEYRFDEADRATLRDFAAAITPKK